MKLIRIIFYLIITVFIVSCKNEKTDIKIGLLIPASDGYRWPTDKYYIEKAVQKRNVQVYTKSAENDENLQLKQADELLELGVDVLIVVAANSNTAGAIVRNAENYNVPVIAYDRLIKNCDLNYFISFDEKKIAEIMLNYSLKRISKGNYVLFWGDSSDPNALAIKNHQNKLLKDLIDNGDINVVYKTYVENWSRDITCHKMKEILEFSDEKIDAVITSYDGLALGVVDAYRELGINEYPLITGQDAELEALHCILDEEIAVTEYKSIKSLANASVELAIKLTEDKNYTFDGDEFRNNGRKEVPAIMLEPKLVNINNIKTIVIADSMYTEEEVYIKK